MSRFWLLQRVKYEPTPGRRFWSDAPSNFYPEYMGSAEFEFGAMPESLKRLVPIADSLVFERVVLRGASFDIVHKPSDTGAASEFGAWLDATLAPDRRGATTKEWPWAFIARLEGRLPATQPAGRGGKEHQRKVYSWENDWRSSGVVLWDLGADAFCAFSPGQGPDGQPSEGVVAALLNEMRAVAAQRRGA